ncbi:hypothetical protein L4X63_14675 [Geomonas sp. Red32]|uniref:hypothetical protein n=1 Tax=Geomonas sp. Red32 TaxID=2912856 RepID=UPI00202D031F|nr:hypothetical protein [Geomonas sp. Red32]MCM0082837.1 hypothetical protein [Geomonas sp. Red32]
MKHKLFIVLLPLMVLACCLSASLDDSAYAQRGGRGAFVGRGGGGHIARGGGFRGGGYHHGGHFGGGVFIGGPWFWDPFFYPFYPYYAYPYYSSPSVIIQQQQPQEYIMQPSAPEQPQGYWYYCKESNGYYPYVKRCPGGWMRVAPTPATPPETPPE